MTEDASRICIAVNCKNGQKVSVIQQWDKKKPVIRYMLRNFRRYLIQEKLDEINDRHMKRDKPNISISSHAIRWIESLLQTPIHEYRKYCSWRILAPFLVNVRKLSDKESTSAICVWLDNCKFIKRLTFDPKYLSKYYAKRARRIGYYPISWNALKLENIYLYRLLNLEKASW